MRSPIERWLIATGAAALVTGWVLLLRLALNAGSVWLLAILIALLIWVVGRLIGRAVTTHARRRRAARLAELAKQCCADDVRFLMRRPSWLRPEVWTPLLVQAYRAHHDATESTAQSPVAALNVEAKRLLGGALAAPFVTTSEDGVAPVPHDATLRFVPTVPGCRFDPPVASAVWSEASLSIAFRVRADASLDGETARGSMSIFAGTLLLAEMALVLRVTSDAPATAPPEEAVPASPYRRVFASYSHRDEAVVRQMEVFARAFGDDFMRDVTRLRSGELWNARIERLIEEADVFQLFWSSNSMRSEYVAREWRHALSLQRPNFIRPVYWEEPLPAAPDRDLPPEALRRIHFQRLPIDLPGSQPHTTQPAATGSRAADDALPAPRPASGPAVPLPVDRTSIRPAARVPAAPRRTRRGGWLPMASLGVVAVLAGLLVLDRGLVPRSAPPDAAAPIPGDDLVGSSDTIGTGAVGPTDTTGGPIGGLSGSEQNPPATGGIAVRLLPPPSELRIGPFAAAAADTGVAAIGTDVQRRLVRLQAAIIGGAPAAGVDPARTLTGRVARGGSGYVIELRMTRTTTAEILWSAEVAGPSSAALADRIVEEVASH